MSKSIKKNFKKKLKLFLYSHFHWYKGKYLAIHLKGGLCNKLYCLISACDIAIKENSFLIEPYFGWEKKILFSDIYDLDYFNLKMGQFTAGRDLIVSREKINERPIKKKSVDNVIDLWDYSEKEIAEERNLARINRDSIKLRVLRALKLKPEYEKIVRSFTENKKFTAIQIRTESDWEQYAKTKIKIENEKIFVSLEDIFSMLSNFNIVGDLFFTSGQNHTLISENLRKLGREPQYFYEPNFEYEVNAAINFEICCESEYFIGLSRSTYSNLISLKRAVILGNDQSFIYNYNDNIYKRLDKGIQVMGEIAINRRTIFE